MRFPPPSPSTGPRKVFGTAVGLLVVWCFPSLLLAAPTISQISPALGQPGDVVTITGSGFGANPAQIDARFGPNRAPVLSASGSSLSVQVPNGQPLGPTKFTVDGSNSLSFITIVRSKIVIPPNPPI